MPLTPSDIDNAKFRIEFRGYNQDDVDTFLEKVREDYVGYIEEAGRLRAQVAAQQTQTIARHREPETGPIAAVALPAPQPDLQFAKIFQVATEAAERYEVEQKLAADHALQEAKTRAQALLQQAEGAAAAKLADAEMQAAQIVQQARQERAEALGGLEQTVEGLEKRVEQLVAIDEEYRTKLEAYMASHLASVSRSPLGAI